MTPAGTSNELDVQNGWEENTHTHTLTVDLFSPSQLLSEHVCKGLEFRVGYEAFYGNDHGKRKHIYITDGIENASLSLHYIGI